MRPRSAALLTESVRPLAIPAAALVLAFDVVFCAPAAVLSDRAGVASERAHAPAAASMERTARARTRESGMDEEWCGWTTLES
jgi:hypothetical protein